MTMVFPRNHAVVRGFAHIGGEFHPMKRRFLIAAPAILAALPMLAQIRGTFGGPPGGGMRGLNFLAGYLGLTDSQKQQAQAIFDAADQASETVRGQLTSARDALRTAVKANQPDAELDRLAAALGAIEGQLAGIRAKADAKFYALLTAEQKEKYDQLGTRSGPGPGRR